MNNSVPILIIAWRRPNIVQQLIEAIRSIKPLHIYVACDGPNSTNPEDAAKVAATRKMIDREIDWTCEVKKLYNEENLGCRQGVTRAISWFFENVEEGIILEDDCIPHPDFFNYCAELLNRYRHDTRIWSICGSNFQLGKKRGNASYYFSIHGDSWGWATWRRAWKHYESAETDWFSFRDSGRLNDVFPIVIERDYWKNILDNLFINHSPSTWDYQWWLICWMNNGLHVWPNSCLISNKGFGNDGTHTLTDDNIFASLLLEDIGELIHPKFILPSRDADEFAFVHRRQGHSLIERERYGKLYPWIVRSRELRREGLFAYLSTRLFRK